MEITNISEKKKVAAFLQSAGAQNGAEFLASLEWSDLQAQEGQKISTKAVVNDGQIVALFNVIKKKMLGGYFFYLPRGPVFTPGLDANQVSDVWSCINKNFAQAGAIFYRVESELIPPQGRKTIDLQPAETLILDLSNSEEELLRHMHQKTRYNIRLAGKKEVSVRQGAASDFAAFWRLMKATGDRDQFGIHSEKHYQVLLGNQDFVKLFVAEYNHQVVAAGLFAFYLNKVTYLHGASDYQNREVMAPYILQWEVIKHAQAGNYQYYDFYGISEQKWPGVTRFKLGFGGRRVIYPGTYDVVLKKYHYYFYLIMRHLRRLF